MGTDQYTMHSVIKILARSICLLLFLFVAVSVNSELAHALSPDRLVVDSDNVTIQVRVFDAHNVETVENHLPTAELMKEYLEELTASYDKEIPISFSRVPDGCFSEDRNIFQRFGKDDLYLRVDVYQNLERTAPDIYFVLCRIGRHRTYKLPDDDSTWFDDENDRERRRISPECSFDLFAPLEEHVFCQTKFRLYMLGLGLEPFDSMLRRSLEGVGGK